MSEERTMILKMLAEGKITVEESERLLNALGSKESNNSKSSDNSKPSDIFSKINIFDGIKVVGSIKDAVKNVQNGIQEVINQVEPRHQELKEKMKEFGGWMEEFVDTVASELDNHQGLPSNSMAVDFIVPAPAGTENCDEFIVENVYGEVNVTEGPEFKLLVSGQISKSAIGEMQSSEWLANKAIKIVDNKFYLGFLDQLPCKAIVNFNLTIPANARLICKTVNSTVKLKGAVNATSIKTVSGNIRTDGANFENTEIETISGVVQIENTSKLNGRINTNSGDIIIRTGNVELLKLASCNGDITVSEPHVALGTEIHATTTSGNIRIEKIDGPWKSAEAISRSGEININWKNETTPANNQKVVIKSGGEGAVFYAETVNGNIKYL